MKEEEGQSSQVDRARMKDLEMEYSKCYVYPEDMGLCRKKEFLALQNAAVAENYLKKSAQTSFICSLRALRNCLLFLSHFQEAWMKENVKWNFELRQLVFFIQGVVSVCFILQEHRRNTRICDFDVKTNE